jgi:hypothetical protein
MLTDVEVMRGSVALVVVVVGCGFGDARGRDTTSGVQGECALDDDCVGAGVKCCDCPAFAVPVASPGHAACDSVPCPYRHCPRNVRAACDQGRCVLACVAMECRQSCLFGFAVDTSGCLTCECAGPTLGCLGPSDCVQVRADCCGCKRGGRETAVLADEVDAHEAALGCSAAPQCPASDICDPALAPQCFQGKCVLATAAALPPNACGRLDLGRVVSEKPASSTDPTRASTSRGSVCAWPRRRGHRNALY